MQMNYCLSGKSIEHIFLLSLKRKSRMDFGAFLDCAKLALHKTGVTPLHYDFFLLLLNPHQLHLLHPPPLFDSHSIRTYHSSACSPSRNCVQVLLTVCIPPLLILVTLGIMTNRKSPVTFWEPCG